MKSFFLTASLIYASVLFGQSELEDPLYRKALTNYRDQQLEIAYQQVNELLSEKPTAKSAYLSGLIHEAMGKDLRAVSDYELTVRLDPTFHEAIFQKALIYLKYNDPGQAVADLSQLINAGTFRETRGIYFQLDEHDQQQNQIMSLSTLESQLYYYRGQAHQKLGNFAEAMDDFSTAIEKQPNEDYFIARGILYSEMNEQDRAVKEFQAAIANDPDNQLAWYNWALLDPTLEIPEDILASGSFVPSLQLLAARALDQEDFILARKYYDLILLFEQTDALTFVNRARVLLKLNEYGAARADLRKAREIAPRRVEVFYLLGNSFFMEEKYEQALAYYDQYLTVDSQNAMVWYNGAMSHMALKKNEVGCHYLERATSLGMDQATTAAARYCQ